MTEDTGQEGLIQRTLLPLKENRDVLTNELADLEEKVVEAREVVREKLAEIKRVDKLLQLGGLLPPSKLGRPRGSGAKKPYKVNPELVETVKQTVDKISPKEFTIRHVAEALGKKRQDAGVTASIVELNNVGYIRLVGARRPDDSVGGGPATHYKKVE